MDAFEKLSFMNYVFIYIRIFFIVCCSSEMQVLNVLILFSSTTGNSRKFTTLKKLWASGECNGFAHHRSRVQDPVGMVLSTELPTDYHHNSIIELSVCWCVWKIGE